MCTQKCSIVHLFAVICPDIVSTHTAASPFFLLPYSLFLIPRSFFLGDAFDPQRVGDYAITADQLERKGGTNGANASTGDTESGIGGITGIGDFKTEETEETEAVVNVYMHRNAHGDQEPAVVLRPAVRVTSGGGAAAGDACGDLPLNGGDSIILAHLPDKVNFKQSAYYIIYI